MGVVGGGELECFEEGAALEEIARVEEEGFGVGTDLQGVNTGAYGLQKMVLTRPAQSLFSTETRSAQIFRRS